MKHEKLNYNGLIEDWKIELILARARYFGIQPHDLPDVQQNIVLDILSFEYDSNNKKGATEVTALTSLIDNKIIDMIRSRSRQRDNHAKFLLENGFTEADSYCDDAAKEWDITEAIEKLSPIQQIVCRLLMDGQSIRRISADLNCHHSVINGIIASIRAKFQKMGVDKWLQ